MMKKTIYAKIKRIKELETEAEGYDIRISSLLGQIKVRDNEITRLQSRITELESTVKKYEDVCVELNVFVNTDAPVSPTPKDSGQQREKLLQSWLDFHDELEERGIHHAELKAKTEKILYPSAPTDKPENEDPRDNPLVGPDDSWIHDVDMGAR